jgi:hypothetical protein
MRDEKEKVHTKNRHSPESQYHHLFHNKNYQSTSTLKQTMNSALLNDSDLPPTSLPQVVKDRCHGFSNAREYMQDDGILYMQ